MYCPFKAIRSDHLAKHIKSKHTNNSIPRSPDKEARPVTSSDTAASGAEAGPGESDRAETVYPSFSFSLEHREQIEASRGSVNHKLLVKTK